MGMPVNQETFNKMVDEDIEWLKANAPESVVYRDHIVACLEMSKKYYKQHLADLPESAWQC